MRFVARRMALLLTVAIAAFASCASAERVDDPAAPPEAALRLEVVRAIQYAHGLEQTFWNDTATFADREAVYEHFRTGFSDPLARNLTDYTWPSGYTRPRPGDATLIPPETVHFLAITDSTAIAYFEAAEALREIWDQDPFVVVRLEREGDRWIIVDSETLPRPPDRQ